MFRVSVQGKVL